MKSILRSDVIFRRLKIVCIAITAGISSAAITGWALNWLILVRIGHGYIPMAQGTALHGRRIEENRYGEESTFAIMLPIESIKREHT